MICGIMLSANIVWAMGVLMSTTFDVDATVIFWFNTYIKQFSNILFAILLIFITTYISEILSRKSTSKCETISI